MKHTFLLAACLCLLSCGGTSSNGSTDTVADYADVTITPEFINNIRQYERLGSFHEGLSKARRDGRWGFINTLGEEVIPCRYSEAGDFCEGRAYVCNGTDLYGYINREGETVVPCKYERVGDYAEGIACVSSGNRLNSFEAYLDFLDLEGNRIEALSGKYAWFVFCDCYGHPTELPMFENGACQVLEPTADESDWPSLYIDTNGAPCERPQAQHQEEEQVVEAFSDCSTDPVGHTLWGLRDKAGNVVLPCVFSYILPFSQGVALAYVETGGNIGHDGIEDEDYIAVYGYVDKQGRHTFTKADFERVGMVPPGGLQ